MAFAALCLSCALVAASVALVLSAPIELRRAGAVRAADLGALAASWMEYLGHKAPLVRLGSVGLLPSVVTRLREALSARGVALTQYGTLAFALCATAAAALAGAVVSMSVLGAAVGVLAAVGAWGALVGGHERERSRRACAQMPDVLRSFASALGAGKSLTQAVEHVGSSVGEPLGTEFLRASFEIRGGRSVEDAVDDLASRVDVPGMALLGTALQISRRTGAPLGDLLSRATRMVNETVGLQRELEVKTAQVRLSSRVVGVLPVVLAGLLVLVSPDYRAGVVLPVGRGSLCAAALLDVLAFIAVRRIMGRTLS
jgi:tight adherence protein B